MRTVFHNGTIRAAAGEAGWASIENATVTGVGPAGEKPASDVAVDLDGGALIPSFCDAHVHLPATGLYASGMNFRGERSLAAIQRAFAERAASDAGILFGGNFEDPLDQPVDRTALDRAVGERPALLARADMHSCVVSSALLRELDLGGLEGVDRDGSGAPTGYLREKAASEAWRWFEQSLPSEQFHNAIETALRAAASKGITSVHEMFVVEWRGWDALDRFLAVVEGAPVEVVTYLGTDEVKRVKDLGFERIGGDYFLDGSFGSHTAWMSAPYDPLPPEGSPAAGISYRDGDDLYEFFMDASEAGMQVGVHAIGDAAIEQAIATWERVARTLGSEMVRSLHHRIEHFECASDDHIRRASELGIGASVQPAFDLYWGGEKGLYAQRIGWERAAAMNRFRSMLAAGLVVGAGSDSTVTPLDPFLQMEALRSHHLAGERIDARTALDLHTRGARALAGDRGSGFLPGAAADLVWVDRDPVQTPAEELASIEVLGTWRGGRRIWPEDADG